MINNSKRIKNSDYNTNSEVSSQIKFNFPIKNQKPNNISFKNSVYLMKSEQKANTHRQYLIDFIRDNNNKNKKQKNEKINLKNNTTQTIQEETEEKPNQIILVRKNFFNDFFNHQNKQERLLYNQSHPNEFLMDIIDYLGEDALHPVDINLMNIKMKNFVPGKISTKSFGLINSYAANTNQGIDRNYNDDRVKIIINMNRPNNYVNKAPWPLMSYFAIFDGHGGKDVASFLSINLHHFLIDEINNIKFGINDEENINNIMESIKSAFLKIDQNILANEKFTNDVGSTATLIFIYYNDLNENIIDNNENGIKNVERTLICANIGDSNGYLISKSNISQITKPHKCEDASEVQRIRDTGGIVFQGRIFGKLILTRTLGDKEMKKYGVIPVPDFYTKKIEKDDLFVIISLSGESDRVVDFAQTLHTKGVPLISMTRLQSNSLANLSTENLYVTPRALPVASKRPYESTLAFFLMVEIWFVSYTQFLAEQDSDGDDLCVN